MIRLKKRILTILSISMFALLLIGLSTGPWSQMLPFGSVFNTEQEVDGPSQDDRSGVSFEDRNLSGEFHRLDEITNAIQAQEPDQEDDGIIPASIEIPAIDVKAEIEPVGILDNGQMGVPSEAEGVAWFEPGANPGEIGNAVMAGHVDSTTGPAIFFDLDELESGDEIIITDEDDRSFIFTVQNQESYPHENAPMENIFGTSETRNLNLITCTGTFNQEEGTHDERLVVYTELNEAQSDIEQKNDSSNPPDSPTNVEVDGSFITWHAVDEEDIVGYRVYQGDSIEESEFEHVESVSPHERKRSPANHGDSTDSIYYVTAVDVYGQESDPSELIQIER
ncbi:sortase (surface protein transpeptidase) [Geomicrobium halophilum]|uniref:Sortase (Surface protein transpeptidase) n=1 Tax=Geomicrobium halophilum TaxID=549000 RepID=A0A841PVK0_9BACL|nr:class F sortase [Geomicrobium halophilum]MBB6448213.1 sortase (surface protein transpeptidase) [Geomicrobium halophilum]